MSTVKSLVTDMSFLEWLVLKEEKLPWRHLLPRLAIAALLPGFPAMLYSEWIQRNDGYPRGLPWLAAIFLGIGVSGNGFSILLIMCGHFGIKSPYLFLTYPVLNLFSWYGGRPK